MSTAPDPAFVSRYAQAALRNARDLLDDAGVLIDHERWPRACSLAVLALEEAAKAYLCGLLPVLPPEEAADIFAWPFAEMNRGHEIKLGIAGVVNHMLRYFTGGPEAPRSLAPALEALEAGSREDNELKQRGFYVGYGDGQVLLPSDLGEREARESVARAAALVPLATDFLGWSASLPAELLAARGEIWSRMAKAWKQGGFEAMTALSERDMGSLNEEQVAQIRAGIMQVLGHSDESEPNGDG